MSLRITVKSKDPSTNIHFTQDEGEVWLSVAGIAEFEIVLDVGQKDFGGRPEERGFGALEDRGLKKDRSNLKGRSTGTDGAKINSTSETIGSHGMLKNALQFLFVF